MRTITVRGDMAPEGQKGTVEIYASSGLDILDGDGSRPLFCLRVTEDGDLEVSTGGMHCHHEGRLLGPAVSIQPKSEGCVLISRDEYKP